MARGLSNLQQFILRQAAQREWIGYVDVLESYFGFVSVRPLERYGEYSIRDGQRVKVPDEMVGQIIDLRPPYFSPEQIGRKRYDAALASLNRACRRLTARGLVGMVYGNPGSRKADIIEQAMSRSSSKKISLLTPRVRAAQYELISALRESVEASDADRDQPKAVCRK